MEDKKQETRNRRVVVKIGSSSLQHPETGDMNLIKMEHLARELCDLRNQGMDVCLVSSGAIATGRKTIGLTERFSHSFKISSDGMPILLFESHTSVPVFTS